MEIDVRRVEVGTEARRKGKLAAGKARSTTVPPVTDNKKLELESKMAAAGPRRGGEGTSEFFRRDRDNSDTRAEVS